VAKVIIQDDIAWDRIELDLVSFCDKKCPGCVRFCDRQRGNERLQMEDIETFMVDTVDGNKVWSSVAVLGGEPTLHQQFEKITFTLSLLYPDLAKRIAIVTNGFGKQEKLAHVPRCVEVVESKKDEHGADYFTNVCRSPMDIGIQPTSCAIVTNCGLSFSSRGYCVCPVAGSIARVCGWDDFFVSRLDELTEEKAEEQLKRACAVCGRNLNYGVKVMVLGEQPSTYS